MYSYWIATHLLKLYRRISSLELRYSAKCVYVKEREQCWCGVHLICCYFEVVRF